MLLFDKEENGGSGISEYLYGVFSGSIYSIRIDGTTQTVKSGKLMQTPGLEWGGATTSSSSYYFWASTGAGSLPSILYKVFPYLNAAIQVGTGFGLDPCNPTQLLNMRELAYDTDNNTLYGTDYSHLYSINTITGQAAFIGAFGNGFNGMPIEHAWSMEYDRTLHKLVIVDQLYADPFGAVLGDAIMYYVNTATGAATYVGNTHVQALTDLYYSPFSSKMFASGNRIFRFYDANTTNAQVNLKSIIAHNMVGLAGGFVEQAGVPVTITSANTHASVSVTSTLDGSGIINEGTASGLMNAGTSASVFKQKTGQPAGIGQTTSGQSDIILENDSNNAVLHSNIHFNTNYNGTGIAGYGKAMIQNYCYNSYIQIGTSPDYPEGADGLMLVIDGTKFLRNNIDYQYIPCELDIYDKDQRNLLLSMNNYEDIPNIKDSNTVNFMGTLMVKAGQRLEFQCTTTAEFNQHRVNYNNDSIVDYKDLRFLISHWLSSCGLTDDWCQGTDYDYSGSVDFFDYAYLAKVWRTPGETTRNQTLDCNLALTFRTVQVPTYGGGLLNDDCSNAIMLYQDQPYQSTTIGATGSDISSCGYYDDKDVWFQFSPLQNGTYQIQVLDPCNMYPTISIYQQCDSPEIQCIEYWNLQNSYIEMQPYTTYLLRLAGYYHRQGNFTITVNYIQPPYNDDCDNAEEIYLGDFTYGTNIGAYGSDITTCGQNDTHDVWYQFTPPKSDNYTFLLSEDSASYAPTIAIFNTCEGGEELTCARNDAGSPAALTYPMLEATTYFVRVSLEDSSMSTFTLQVAGPPSNDNCENALPIIALDTDYFGSTLGATGTSTSSCGLDDTADVWYSYTAQNNGFVRFHLEDTDNSCGLPITISLYDGCQGNEIACSETGLYDNCDNTADIGFILTQSQTYYIRIARDGHSTGNYRLIANYFTPPANDQCSNAVPVNLYDEIDASTWGATGSDITSCGDNDNADVWYSFTPEDSYTAFFFVANVLSSQGPCMTIALFDNCDNGSELACGECTCWGSEISYDVVQGQTYYIRVSRSENLMADFWLSISDVPQCGVEIMGTERSGPLKARHI